MCIICKFPEQYGILRIVLLVGTSIARNPRTSPYTFINCNMHSDKVSDISLVSFVTYLQHSIVHYTTPYQQQCHVTLPSKRNGNGSDSHSSEPSQQSQMPSFTIVDGNNFLNLLLEC